MELNKFLKQCNDNDVLSIGKKLFKIAHVINAIKIAFSTQVPNTLYECLKNSDIDIQPMRGFRYHSNQTSDSYRQDNTLWFTEGINAEILRVNNKGWQKGKIKIKITVEFEPDEPEQPESPLDDIRQTIIE